MTNSNILNNIITNNNVHISILENQRNNLAVDMAYTMNKLTSALDELNDMAMEFWGVTSTMNNIQGGGHMGMEIINQAMIEPDIYNKVQSVYAQIEDASATYDEIMEIIGKAETIAKVLKETL